MKNMLLTLIAIVGLLPPISAQEASPIASLEDALAQIKTYTVGGDFAPVEFIIEKTLEVQADPQAANALANQLAALMAGEATFDCKRNLARQLQLIAGEEQLSVLSPLLTDPECAHLIRYIYQAVPGAAVDAAFAAALAKAEGALKVGLINTIAQRSTEEAVQRLAPLTQDADESVALAAITGLGATRCAKAGKHLLLLRGKLTNDACKAAALDGIIKCANAHIASGDTAQATLLLESLFREGNPRQVRRAAFAGLVKAGGAQSADLVVQVLKQDDPYWRLAAVSQVRRLPGPENTRRFAEALADLSTDLKPLLIAALADRGDPCALAAIQPCLEAEEEAVQTAAIEAAGKLGNAETAVTLLTKAAHCTGAQKHLLRESLYHIADPAVNPELVKRLGTGEDSFQIEVLRAISERSYAAATSRLLEMAAGESKATQQEVFRALGKVAPPETLPQLVALLVTAKPGSLQDAAESAVVATARRMPNPAQRPEELLKALDQHTDTAIKVTLISALGALGGEEALPPLKAALSATQPELRQAALEALSRWETSAPRDVLLAHAKSGADAKEKDLALEGYVRMLRMASDMRASDMISAYQEVLTLSASTDMKRRVISGLAELKAPGAIQMLQACQQDAQVQEEVKVAIDKIRKAFEGTTASHQAGNTGNAFDGNPETRWDTAAMMAPGMWFQYDMQASAPLKGIVLDTTGSPSDYPRGYEVYVYDDPAAMGKPVASGTGSQAVMRIEFPETTGRYVLIVQTGRADHNYWSIHELGLVSP